jgi:epoxyqueuosine reductase
MADPDDLSREVVSLAIDAGCVAVGVASAEVFEETRRTLHQRKARGVHGGMQFTYRNPDRSTDPGRIIAGARSLVVAAWDYTASVAAYARHDYYRDLRNALAPVAALLVARGWRAVVVADDNALVDRAAAHRAGIGWFGKNSLVLLPGLGSRVVLGTVVTDAALRPSQPVAPAEHGEGCGTCRRCQVACPTGALDEAGVVDARRCLAWLLQAPGPFPIEHRAALGDRIYGCDECQRVCPVNRAADRRHPAPLPEPDSRPRVEVLRLLGAVDAELLAEFGRWYIPGRDPRYLRRNALVVLGNVGDGGDPEVVATLARWIGGDDALLAEHARWAAIQLGRSDLVDAAR